MHHIGIGVSYHRIGSESPLGGVYPLSLDSPNNLIYTRKRAGDLSRIFLCRIIPYTYKDMCSSTSKHFQNNVGKCFSHEISAFSASNFQRHDYGTCVVKWLHNAGKV